MNFLLIVLLKIVWAVQKKKTNDVISALYNPIVKKSKDRETGEIDGRYPDNIRLKLPLGMENLISDLRFDNNEITDREGDLFVKDQEYKNCKMWWYLDCRWKIRMYLEC